MQTTRALDIVIFISCSIYYFQNNHFLLPNLCKKSHGQYSTHISKEYYGQLTETIHIWCFIKKRKMYYTKKFYDLFIIKVSLLPYQTFFAVVFQAILTKLISVQHMIRTWSCPSTCYYHFIALHN